MQKKNVISIPFKFSETSLAYLKWRMCEMEREDAWKSVKCQGLWKIYEQLKEKYKTKKEAISREYYIKHNRKFRNLLKKKYS